MPELLAIQPVSRPVNATIRVPGSKSITNRALMLAALADGCSRISGALYSDDTRYMAAALDALGIAVSSDEAAHSFEVHGAGGTVPASAAELFVGNSGTSARFLTAFAALGHGTYRIDGVVRMRERPIADLLDALRPLGADAVSEACNGCPPVRVAAHGLRGGATTLRGEASSQYLTALLLVSPCAGQVVTVAILGELASKPYVDITLAMMRNWGVEARNEGYRTFVIRHNQRYQARDYVVEPDASSASYFFASAAVTGGRIRVLGLGSSSLQGDLGFVDVLERMGCTVTKAADWTEVQGPERLRGVDVDMNGISDTVMTLAAIAPFADSPTIIRNVAHIRRKETDRISAVAQELRRLGVTVEERVDGLTIHPADRLRATEIETYDDHRMAMSFAVTGLRSPGVAIKEPGCVAKTFPGYYARFREMCDSAGG